VGGTIDHRDTDLFERRRGWTLRERLRAPDSFGLLFLLLSASTLLTAWSDSLIAGAVTVLFQGASLLFALITSRGSRSTIWFATILLAGGLTFTLAAVAADASNSDALVLSSIVRLTLTVAALVAIARRLAVHPVVNGATLMGALCVYLLLGLLFASAYGLIQSIDSQPLFVQMDESFWIDRLYFSFVTLTTVGYGDLSVGGDIARLVAMTEAMIGQLYLVSVVALVVGNLGRTRPDRTQVHDRGKPRQRES
jgi:voltage-gated potassium channel